MRRAAEIWAECRAKGFPFSDDKRLDGDAILIAQVESLGSETTAMTSNPSDIGRFLKVIVLPPLS